MSSSGEQVLTITNLSKTFGGTEALRNVDFDVRVGEIHALVGQNGSGKSTLIKILAGYHLPDRGGTAAVEGNDLELGNAGESASSGLRFVHQDLGLVPALGALDNLALGRGYKKRRGGTINWPAEAQAGREALAELGYDFDLKIPVDRLSASERTGVAIARALESGGDAKVLFLDEPTASLPAAEAERLFDVVRAVADRGVGVVYVSHRFQEVMVLSDRVSVLRDGLRVATERTAELEEARLVELTVGRVIVPSTHDDTGRNHASGNPLLEAKNLTAEVVTGLDLAIYPGEIVGIAGVTGSGREEVAGMLFGAIPRGGTVTLAGSELPGFRPGESQRRGMAFVPAERLRKAAFLDMTLRENLLISNLAPVFGPLGVKKTVELSESLKWLDKLEVVPRATETRLVNLSGGNQQKVVLGRVLRLDPQVLVLDEPTQGVDVGAKDAIHQIVRDAANKGTAVLVASTESEELVTLCDRIIVLVGGSALGEYPVSVISSDQLTELTMRKPGGGDDDAVRRVLGL